ncbi:HlyD family secretion protein [Motilimonas cestriensis]|uniref:HlyD family secretion protein n=1 Tax=Motilimonas cestriensis TaxID=2742685 RepID=A0ABS8WCI1_9GAMM|nr:HlyD family secretion protein [Motilimonas cestriensis]MCE2596263.1 HlyD family secretion protein [Motilimonas cestriensis]
MDLLLILTYTAICVVVFKVFKIPLNKWTVPTAVLGGIVLIGTLIFLMNYNHPYSEMAREYYVTTPVVPAVTGQVIEVPVKPNVPVMKGDLLFKLDPTPFQSKVDSLKARLKSATDDLNRAYELKKRGVGKDRDIDVARATVDDIKAQLVNAEFQLAQTEVKAMSDGYVVQQALYPGMLAVAMPLRPVMIFVNKDGQNYYTAWFRQNSLLRLKKGYEAEIAFDGIPGRVFKAEVANVAPAMVEGQVQPSGTMISPLTAPQPGRVAVLLKITDPAFDEFSEQIPGGSFGQAAVYSDHFHHVAVMRKILLRMSSWMSYFFPFH